MIVGDSRGPTATILRGVRMQQYDVALKLLLQGPAGLLIRDLVGSDSVSWLNIELPEIRNTRMDLLAEAGGQVVHIELQSGNDAEMALRMADYHLGIFRKLRRAPRQIVLYVGEEPLAMKPRFITPAMTFEYEVIDIRRFDGERLLASEYLVDNIVAILARLENRDEAVRRIVKAILRLPPGGKRDETFQLLTVLSGLRQMEDTVQRETSKVPLTIDIMQNKILGPAFKRGLEEGRQVGLQEGRQEGRQEGLLQGELTLLRRQIEKRFGSLPAWAEQRLTQCSVAELEDLSVRVLDAQTVDELLEGSPGQTGVDAS